MIWLIAVILVLVFFLVAALAHGNWVGAGAMVFYLVILVLWWKRRVDLGYAFRKSLPLAWVIVAVGALYMASEMFRGCEVILKH